MLQDIHHDGPVPPAVGDFHHQIVRGDFVEDRLHRPKVAVDPVGLDAEIYHQISQVLPAGCPLVSKPPMKCPGSSPPEDGVRSHPGLPGSGGKFPPVGQQELRHDSIQCLSR